MIRAGLASAVLAVALSGCGPAAADIDAVAPLAGGTTGEQASRGRALFVSSCAACHALADADTDGTVGPDLDELRPGAVRVARKVQAGGGGMPSFSGRLSRAEIALLAAYVGAVVGE